MHPLILLLALPLVPGQMKDEPKVVGGKPMQFWLDELKSKNPLYREEALAALGELGAAAKDALPMAEKLLDDENASVRRRAAMTVWQLGGSSKHAAKALADEVVSSDPYKRQTAMQTLTKLGPDAAPAIPVLLPLMDSKDPFNHSFQVNTLIQGIGKAAIPVLIESLDHKDVVVRVKAAQVLAWEKNQTKDAIPALTKRLQDEDARVRMRAAWALWENEERGEKVLDVLAGGFAEEEPAFRQTVLGGLVKLHPKPKGAARIYRAALTEKDVGIKVEAAAGLWELEKNAKEVVPALKEVLVNEYRDPRQSWRNALPLVKRIGAEAKDTVLELLVLMRGPEGEYVIEIALALVAIGPPAVEQIMDVLGGMGPPLPPARASLKNPALQPMLSQILGLIGKASVDDALDRIEAMNPRAREAACRALSACGPLAKAALKKLQAALKDSDPEVQRYAAEALGNLGDDAKEAAEALAALAGNENPDVRLAALKALARMKTDARLKLDAAMKGIKDTTVASQVAGIELLWQADPKHADIVPKIKELLDRDTARPTLLPLIGRMGPDAKDVVPALIKLFERKDGTLALQVVQTLARIGPGAKETIPALLDVVKRKVYSGGMHDTYAALHALGVEDKAAIPILAADLRFHDSGNPSPHLYELLGRFKHDAKEAIRDLQSKAQFSFSPYERVLATKALTQIDPEMVRKDLIPILRTQSKNENGGGPAALQLWRMDPSDKEALELLQQLIEKDVHNTHRMIESLGQLGPDVKEMLPTLEAMQKKPGYSAHTALVVAIARIGRKPEQFDRAMPFLLKDLLGGDAQARFKTTRLLEDIGPPAKEAVPALLLLSRHTSPGISSWLERALMKIDPEAAARVGVR